MKWTKSDNTYLFRFMLQFPEKESHELAAFLIGNWKFRKRTFGALYQHIDWMQRMKQEGQLSQFLTDEVIIDIKI